ncbi:MAG: N-6 DNA methylase [Pirellulales bacterium]|nr:N-6 DNA methylase [Pirellulales bacterium]
MGVIRPQETESAVSTNRPPPLRCLSARHLAEDFGLRAPATKECLVRLHEAVSRAEDAYSHWRPIFDQLWGSAEHRLLVPLEKLMRKVGIGDYKRPLPFLFALQTHYALLLSLLVKRFENLRRCEIIDPVFAWCFDADCPKLRSAIGRLAEKMESYDLRIEPGQNQGAAGDLLKDLHHALFPRALRHHLGEYYTPDWLAEHVLDQLEFDGRTPGPLLDPACGSGTFLLAAIRRIRQACPAQDSAFPSPPFSPLSPLPSPLSSPPCPALPCLDAILKNVVGIDLNPLAVMAARANYLIAIQDLIPAAGEPLDIPIYLGDSILGLAKRGQNYFSERTEGGYVDNSSDPFLFVAGNPPWIAWDNLPGEYREATKPLWEKYGLFSLSGNAARHGGGKKDLSMLMLYAAADRYLKSGGRLGFVITQTLFQTKGAGDGFRRFRLGGGVPLKVLRVDDLTTVKPFDDAANWTSTIVLEKGAETVYPVDYVRWVVGQVSNLSNLRQVGNLSYEKIACTAAPIDPRRPTSPWLVQPRASTGEVLPLPLPCPADYRAYLGANSGGANGVYWVEVLGADEGGVRIRNVVEKCKKPVERVERIIEPDLLYPLVRWSDLARYSPLPRYHLLLVQDCQRRVGLEESMLKRRFPLTYDYLKHFETLLTSRAAYRRYQRGQPFYSMYNVGPYTAGDCKVIWRRMDKRLTAAVVEPVEHPLLGCRPVVPQETCVLIPCRSADEGHYLCAMLNSEPAGRLLESHCVRGGKGFGTPSILDYLPLRRYEPENPRHRELADCSREAHKMLHEQGRRAVTKSEPIGNLSHEGDRQTLEGIQMRIDRLADETFRK